MHVNTWSGVASSLLSFLLRTILGIAMLHGQRFYFIFNCVEMDYLMV